MGNPQKIRGTIRSSGTPRTSIRALHQSDMIFRSFCLVLYWLIFKSDFNFGSNFIHLSYINWDSLDTLNPRGWSECLNVIPRLSSALSLFAVLILINSLVTHSLSELIISCLVSRYFLSTTGSSGMSELSIFCFLVCF